MAAESGELLEKGIAHEGSIVPITFALKRALESSTTVGEAHVASARPNAAARRASAPGARPQRKSREVEVGGGGRKGGRGKGAAGQGDLI